MKKALFVLLFVIVGGLMSSCGFFTKEDKTKNDSTTVVTDSTKVDTLKVDTTKVVK